MELYRCRSIDPASPIDKGLATLTCFPNSQLPENRRIIHFSKFEAYACHERQKYFCGNNRVN